MNTRRRLPAAVALFAGCAATIAEPNWASALCPAVAAAGLRIHAGAFFADSRLPSGNSCRTLLAPDNAARDRAGSSGPIASPRIALASTSAFAVSELADLTIYTPRQRHHLAAVGLSNAIGLLIDSLLFLPLALGTLTFLGGHVAGKPATTVLAVAVLTGARPVTASNRAACAFALSWYRRIREGLGLEVKDMEIRSDEWVRTA